MTMAKALTAGYIPLGAAIAGERISGTIDRYHDIHTYGGHPAAAVAALTAISIYEEEGLLARAASEGEHALATLGGLLDDVESVGDVRGLGLWAAVDFTADRATREPLPGETLDAIVARTRELGVLVSRNGRAIEVAPPLVIAREDLDDGLARFMQAVRELCG